VSDKNQELLTLHLGSLPFIFGGVRVAYRFSSLCYVVMFFVCLLCVFVLCVCMFVCVFCVRVCLCVCFVCVYVCVCVLVFVLCLVCRCCRCFWIVHS
jgi:hypothetical protein